MRTESQPSPVNRLRAEVARARHWVGGRGRWTRLLVAVAVVASIGGAVYFSLPTVEEPVWLYGERKLSQDGAQAIQSALATEDIQTFSDGTGRIGVRPAAWSKALAALIKHKVEPPSLSEIEKETQASTLWDTAEQREQRLHHGMERTVEVMIERLSDVRSANVTIQRDKIRGGLRPEWKYAGFVYVETNGGRELSHRTVQSIEDFLVAKCSGLKGDAVSISDQTGKFYRKAGNPNNGMISRTLARADELRELILEHIGYVKGVKVVVRMETAAPEPAPAPQPLPRPVAKEASTAETLANQPIDLGPELPPTAPAVVAKPVAAPAVPRAHVLVQVPRSYYLDAYSENFPGRQPSLEELTPFISRTSESIRKAVEVTVPSQELGKVELDTVPDPLGQPRLTATPLPSSEHWLQNWHAWLPGVAAGAGIGLAIVIATGFGVLASRRPKALASGRTTRRGGIAVDPPGEAVHGPSERVRELVRANPDAAAGVLRRWIGQDDEGGHG